MVTATCVWDYRGKDLYNTVQQKHNSISRVSPKHGSYFKALLEVVVIMTEAKKEVVRER